jgi:hypothetical protein
VKVSRLPNRHSFIHTGAIHAGAIHSFILAPFIHSFIHPFIHPAMIVIIRANHWELISSPQTVAAAWQLADKLTAETGVAHWVGRM